MSVTLSSSTQLHNRYEIRGVIGHGGFGITYDGFDTHIMRRVAIKELYLQDCMLREEAGTFSISEDERDNIEKYKQDYLREARIIGQFAAEAGVVDVLDYFEENNTAYIVMEYLEGETLSHRLQEKGAMQAKDIFTWMLPLMHTLKHIHDAGVIHRDISPDNIMVKQGDTFVLCDFGASRNYQERENLSYIVKDHYAPIEQSGGSAKQGPWTDIYALSATIYECITGKKPDTSISRLLYDELEAPSKLGVEMPSALESILMKGLAVNPEDRYQDLSEMIAAIESGLPQEAQETSNVVKIPKRMIMIALIIVAVIIATIVFRRQGATPREDTHYDITLVAPDDMSIKGFNEAKETLKERLDILCEGEDYTLSSEDTTIHLMVPKAVFHGLSVEYVLQSYISRAIDFYLCAGRKNDDGQYEPMISSRLTLSRTDITSVELREGHINEIDASKINIHSDDYQYLRFQLSDAFVQSHEAELKALGEHITLTQDLDHKDYYYINTFAGDDNTFYLVDKDQEGSFMKLLHYNLTHPALEKSLYYQVSWEIVWHTMQERSGTHQTDISDIPSKYPVYYLKYGSYDQLTNGQKVDAKDILGKRLDTLSCDYALGSVNTQYTEDQSSSDTLALKVASDGFSSQLLNQLVSPVALSLVGDTGNVALSKLGDESCAVIKHDEQLSFVLDVTATDYLDAVVKTFKKGQKVYLYNAGLPVFEAKVSEENGIITFDRIYGQSKAMTIEDEWYTAMMMEILSEKNYAQICLPYVYTNATGDKMKS